MKDGNIYDIMYITVYVYDIYYMINFNGGKLQYGTFFTLMLLVFLFFLSLQDKGGREIAIHHHYISFNI